MEVTVLGQGFWIVVRYCPSRPMERLDETIEVAQWAMSRTLTRPPHTHGVVGGDFNCNPWSSAHPLAAKQLVDLFRGFCQQLGVSRVCPSPDAPTWYNPAGIWTCIDH